MGKVVLMLNEVDCMGCHACEVACKQEHGSPAGPKVIRIIESSPYFKPLFCHHCEDAPCRLACPEGAITKDGNTGIVLVDREKCDGCKAEAGKSGPEKQETSSCKYGCPAQIDVQGVTTLAAKGKFAEALRLIKLANPFPSLCGRLCPHPCEAGCFRSQIDQPLAIRAIERFLGDLEIKGKIPIQREIKSKRKEKVAVIGSGPAGLACAYYLALEGYRVVVFEKDEHPGGMLAVGIPAYRLPAEILAAQIEMIRSLGVVIKTRCEVGRKKTIGGLRKEGFKAFFIAIGAHKGSRLNVPGEELAGVYQGLEYLKGINSGSRLNIGKRVAVIGGGNAAIDSVRSARRLGSDEAFILYRRGMKEMPATPEEINQCREEGIPIRTLTQPLKFFGSNGRVTGIEAVRMRLTELDDTGRRKAEPVLGTEFKIKVDAVIVAIGQEADWDSLASQFPGSLTDRGILRIDPLTLQSDHPDVFSGGDGVRGSRTVVEAISDGRRAAVSINRYLRGENLSLGRGNGINPIKNPQHSRYEKAPRIELSCLAPDLRITSFREVQKGITKALVLREAKRCISCGTSCVQICPYEVMQFDQPAGKAIKCDLCLEKREKNEAPACLAVCPTRCILWGDPEKQEGKYRIL